jgi:hypothetical protein
MAELLTYFVVSSYKTIIQRMLLRAFSSRIFKEEKFAKFSKYKKVEFHCGLVIS